MAQNLAVVNLTRGHEIFLMEHPAAGQVGQKHSDCNRKQEERLKAFDNRQVNQHAGDDQHHDGTEGGKTALVPENRKARRLQKLCNTIE